MVVTGVMKTSMETRMMSLVGASSRNLRFSHRTHMQIEHRLQGNMASYLIETPANLPTAVSRFLLPCTPCPSHLLVRAMIDVPFLQTSPPPSLHILQPSARPSPN